MILLPLILNHKENARLALLRYRGINDWRNTCLIPILYAANDKRFKSSQAIPYCLAVQIWTGQWFEVVNDTIAVGHWE
jgi:hypothetical protein